MNEFKIMVGHPSRVISMASGYRGKTVKCRNRCGYYHWIESQ